MTAESCTSSVQRTLKDMTADQSERSEQLIKERGRVYGDALLGHTNIGMAWTAILQQHYGIALPNIIPPEIVALMMASLKIHRATRVFHQDNYDDAFVYLGFANKFQKLKHHEQSND